MATCKDCIHYDICVFSLTGNENEKCMHFKNKAELGEVVRCKDCKKFKPKCEDILFEDVVGICERTITGFFDDGEEVCGNDFCSYGKRSDT